MKATEENLATADADCVGSFVADTGYSNGEHASRCEEIGIVTHVPAKRSVNPQGLFDRTAREELMRTST